MDHISLRILSHKLYHHEHLPTSHQAFKLLIRIFNISQVHGPRGCEQSVVGLHAVRSNWAVRCDTAVEKYGDMERMLKLL